MEMNSVNTKASIFKVTDSKSSGVTVLEITQN